MLNELSQRLGIYIFTLCSCGMKYFFFFFLWLYSPLWTLASLMILPQIFLSRAFFHHVSTFNNFTSFRTLSSDINLGLPFFREPSGCEKVIFLQGEFSSILTKCPSHLILAGWNIYWYYFIFIFIFEYRWSSCFERYSLYWNVFRSLVIIL
jgi:hypothetical protein